MCFDLSVSLDHTVSLKKYLLLTLSMTTMKDRGFFATVTVKYVIF